MAAILLALTSHATLGDTGKPTGFYVPEAAHPHHVLTQAGHRVGFVSVTGGAAPMTGTDKDPITAGFLADPDVAAQLRGTPAPGQVDAVDYQAIVFVGGHGAMWDFPNAAPLHDLAAAIYARGGIIAAVCHGPAALLGIRQPDGTPLVEGKRVAAFTNDEEAAVGLTDVVPFLLQTKLTEQGAHVITAADFAPNAIADGRLITGQNPASAVWIAELLLHALAAR